MPPDLIAVTDILPAASTSCASRRVPRVAGIWNGLRGNGPPAAASTTKAKRCSPHNAAAGWPASAGGRSIPSSRAPCGLRRLYLSRRLRRQGIGRALLEALLVRAGEAGRPITVNAARGSTVFWNTLGFIAEAGNGHTHRLATR